MDFKVISKSIIGIVFKLLYYVHEVSILAIMFMKILRARWNVKSQLYMYNDQKCTQHTHWYMYAYDSTSQHSYTFYLDIFMSQKLFLMWRH